MLRTKVKKKRNEIKKINIKFWTTNVSVTDVSVIFL